MSASPVDTTAIRRYAPTHHPTLTPKLDHKFVSFSRQLPPPPATSSSSSMRSLSPPPTQFIPRRTAPLLRHRSGGAIAAAAAMRRGDYIDDNSEGESVFEEEELMGGGGSLQSASSVLARGADFEAVLNRSSKWIVSALFATVLLCRHDGEAVWGAMGSVMNAGLCAVLKKILNQQRPDSAAKSDPGMPSSHAQSIFYIAVFIVISIVEWVGTNALGLTLGMSVLVFGAYFTRLRVSQKFHTASQVTVGAIVGSVFSYLWVLLWKVAVSEAFYDLFWVRVLVILGSASFCLSFVLYVMGNWLRK